MSQHHRNICISIEQDKKPYQEPMIFFKENAYLGINSKVLQIHLEDKQKEQDIVNNQHNNLTYSSKTERGKRAM